MTSQIEWTMIAQDYGRRLKFLKTADEYVEELRDGRNDWRTYYRDVTENVYAEQPDTR